MRRPSAEQLLCDSRLPGKIVSGSKVDRSLSRACVDVSHHQHYVIVLVKEVENNFVEEAMRVISKDTEPFQKLLVRASTEIVMHSHTREYTCASTPSLRFIQGAIFAKPVPLIEELTYTYDCSEKPCSRVDAQKHTHILRSSSLHANTSL